MITNQKYWKRYGESVTVFLDRFQHDVLFKTKIVFVTVLMLIVVIDLLALGILSQSLVPGTLQGDLNNADLKALLIQRPAPTLTDSVLGGESTLTSTEIFIVAAGISTLLILALGFIATRVLLAPLHNAIYVQKNFIRQIAHELRTPLSVVRTNIEVALLERDRMSKAELTDELKNAMRHIDKVSGIINNLTTLSTVSRLRLEEYQQYKLNDIIDDSVSQYSDLIERKHLNVDMQYEPDLYIWGNQNAILQMISNLLGNAINFTPPGGSITVSAHGISDSFVRLNIADSGIGIPNEDLKYVFKPFYRSKKAYDGDQGGSGLGLSIVRELVRLHAGRIGIQSVENEGTTVTIDLPIKPKRIPIQPRTIGEGRLTGVDFDYKVN